MRFHDARAEIVTCGAMLYGRGLLTAREGNLSIRLEANRVAITPARACKGDLGVSQILELDASTGKMIRGTGAPSSETALHLAIYRARPDLCAIVHAHPATATGFAAAGVSLEAPVLPELLIELGGCPTAPFAAPGTEELARSIRPLISKHDVMLLANHGALATSSDTLLDACYRMEQLEQAAKIILTAHQLGGPRLLGAEVVRALLK